jgi:hypothetical protein
LLCSACAAACSLQVAGSAGKVLVSGLSKVDSWLEERGLLGKLQPAEVPAAVQDEDGQLNEECQEVSRAEGAAVRSSSAGICVWWPHSHVSMQGDGAAAQGMQTGGCRRRQTGQE